MKSNRSLYVVLMVESLVMLAALLVMQLIIARRLIEPFNKIVGTLKNVKEHHDYSLRIDIDRKDEVGIVADGVDELLEFIEEEELQEKKKQREFAEEAMRRAQESNEAKSRFLFNASHDIRTPMNAIQGFSRIIEKNPEDAHMVRDSIGKILKSSDVLMTLLNDVLELSQIESGKDKLKQERVNLKEFTEKLYLMFAKEMEEKGISFSTDNKITNEDVMLDELKCTRIFMNMLSNAKKFTNEKGNVVFGIHQLSGVENQCVRYEFFVRDNGVGMDEEFQKRAFEQFEMEKSSTISGVVGNGLGLSIIKRLVEQMGGECNLKSEVGKGTRIGAVLTFTIAKKEAVTESVASVQKADFTGRKVLLVEDNEFNREIARYVLEEEGLVVFEAVNGSEAVEKLSAVGEAVDFVLMDIQMPVMDGYEATRMIRGLTDRQVASVPIIAMTANAFKEDRDRCLEVGMDEHIAKPIDGEILFEVLGRFLK